MDLLEFDKKFNRKFSLEEQESEFEAFKVRILNIIPDIDFNITQRGHFEFCQFFGIQYYPQSLHKKYIFARLEKESNELEFIKLVALIFNLPWSGSEKSYHNCCMGIMEAIKISKLPYRIMMDNGTFLIVPAGEKKLDEELVDPVFSFLNSKSKKHFIEAYKNRLEKKYISFAESLRRSLEEFLRFKLKNGKGLQNNIDELGKLLKANKVDRDIKKTIIQTFKYIDSYFNENSKHNDGDIAMEEAQFLVYHVANLMHYISNKINI